jgi:hypothetical protein
MWGIIVVTQAIAEVPTGILGDKLGRKFSIMLLSKVKCNCLIKYNFYDE